MFFFWAAALLVGLAGWACSLWTAQEPRAWRMLLISFLYFTPLAAGLVVWPAIVLLCRGTWTAGLERRALAGVAFAPVSLVTFAALYLSRAHWAAWMTQTGLPNASWLSTDFLFLRDAVALIIFWALAACFVARWPRRPRVLAGWLALAYALVFSLLAFDLAMALDPRGYSTLFGGYFFVSGLYAAVVAWTFLVLARRAPSAQPEQLGDLGKLILTFSLLTAYMMFSQLLVIWYENLPAEALFVVPRLRFEEYAAVSLLVLVVYLGPLVLLVGRRAKRNPLWLGGVSTLLLCGLWLERWWLVTPASKGPVAFGLPEFSLTLAFVAAFALAFRTFHRFAGDESPQGDRA